MDDLSGVLSKYEDPNELVKYLIDKYFSSILAENRTEEYCKLYADALIIIYDLKDKNKNISEEEIFQKILKETNRTEIPLSSHVSFDDNLLPNVQLTEALSNDSQGSNNKEGWLNTIDHYKAFMLPEEYAAFISRLDKGHECHQLIKHLSYRRIQILYRRARVKYSMYKKITRPF